MYWIIKDSDQQFIWDETENVMYQIDEFKDAYPIKANLEKLNHFSPYVELVAKTSTEPPQIRKYKESKTKGGLRKKK
jgi:hypothetical protein